ncbi:serine/threonine-protein kinase [Geodermatophilus sp. CPCC 206100]|uniref:serine/threonine-protein kinase n=1 Tax=Geodermatophilus sp. CPCC 206100 TaxID=3020054 RepID=UPI003AFFD147
MHRPGTVLADRYELSSPVATGGMGQVWRAVDRVLGRQVAVKVLRPEFTENAVFLTRFRTEARLSAGLVHPNIAVLHDYGEVEPGAGGGDRLVYLVMELVEGRPLSTVLQEERRLAPDRTLALLRQVAAGLAAAHAAGVVHRDVKPGNVLVAPDGTVKITDFGIAWSAANTPLTRTGHVVGTAQYLAPEQVRGDKAVPASDVYSWGMVAYECLAGRRAFDGPNPVEIALQQLRELPAPLPDDVPEPLRRLVDRSLAKDVAQRIPDGAALVAAIDDLAAGRDDARTDTLVMPAVRAEHATHVFPFAAPEPADEDAGSAAAEPEEDRPRRRLLIPLLVALVVVAAVAAGALVLGLRGDPAPASATPTPPPAPTTAAAPLAPQAPPVVRVRLTAEEYVGRPVGQVQPQLAGLDLLVRLVAVETAEVPAGQVLALDPVGEVPVGTTVTVTHAVAPPPPPPPPPTVAPTTEAEPTQEQGNGNGNGENRERRRDRDRDRDNDED